MERAGVRRRVTLVRRPGDLGLELRGARGPARSPPAPTSACSASSTSCRKGMRRSLYVKDDDYRLSFLHGNYITLSDLAEEALARIVEQRLSPLYVSVHATDPALRHRLLGSPATRPRSCPGWSGSPGRASACTRRSCCARTGTTARHLERTVLELAPLAPAGGHRGRSSPWGSPGIASACPQLRTLRDDEARALIDTVDRVAGAVPARAGHALRVPRRRGLSAGGPGRCPPARAYEGFAIAEDGVGLVRRFEDAFARSVSRAARVGAAGAA